MNKSESACLTFDGACDAAIDLEGRIYQHFLQAIRLVRDERGVRVAREEEAD